MVFLGENDFDKTEFKCAIHAMAGDALRRIVFPRNTFIPKCGALTRFSEGGEILRRTHEPIRTAFIMIRGIVSFANEIQAMGIVLADNPKLLKNVIVKIFARKGGFCAGVSNAAHFVVFCLFIAFIRDIIDYNKYRGKMQLKNI